jgi:hypothetical protein
MTTTEPTIPDPTPASAETAKPPTGKATTAKPAKAAPAPRPAPAPTYPHPSGDVTVLGPGVILDGDRRVINHGGRNFYAEPDPADLPRVALTTLDTATLAAVLFGSADTLRVQLTLCTGEQITGSVVSVLADTETRQRWVGIVRHYPDEDSSANESRVEHIALSQLAGVARWEPIDMDETTIEGDPEEERVILGIGDFRAYLVGRVAAVSAGGVTSPEGRIVRLQQGADMGGQRDWWEIQLDHEGVGVLAYEVHPNGRDGLLMHPDDVGPVPRELSR